MGLDCGTGLYLGSFYGVRMPHMDYLKGFLESAIFGGPEKHDSADSHAEERTHEGQSEDMNGDAAGRTSAGSGKRVRDSSEQKSLTNKKQKVYGPDEGRLTGNYNNRVPGNRVPIKVPTTHDRMNNETSAEADKPQANTVRRKPGGDFGHRIQNNMHAPQAGLAGNRMHPVFKPDIAKPTAPPKSTRSMARGAALDDDVGDSFPSSTKRRKTNGAPKTSNQQNPVELSDDDDSPVGTVHAVNGRPVSSNGTSAIIEIDSQSQPTTDYFGAREQRKINQHLVSGPQSKRRRKSNGQNTPSTSSFAPNDHRDTVPSMSNTQAELSGIDDLGIPTLPRYAKSGGQKNSRLPHPSTTLGQGVDDDFGVEEMQRRKDDHSVARLNGNVGRLAGAGPSLKSVIAKQAQRANTLAEQMTQREPRQTRVANSAEGNQSLRGQFKRDRDTPPPQQQHQQEPQRQSRVSNMQVASNSGKGNTVQESPDQLQGGNTAIQRRQMQQVPSRTVAGSHDRRGSSSGLTPTQFTTSAQKPARTTQPSRIPQRIPEHDDNVRISLEQILSRGCVLETRREEQYIDLVWQTENAAFVVELNGEPYRILGTKEYMTIGKPESGTWHEGKNSTQVVLKGSTSENRSSGNVLLYFTDKQGMQACGDWLMVASGDTMQTKVEDNGRIEKMFRNLAISVQLDADKYATQARTKRMAEDVVSQHAPARQTRKQSAIDDQIVYGQQDDMQKRQPSARSRMQGDVEPASSQLLASPYFADDSTRVPRKSTRQSKAVIERTPTPPPPPPRWTEIHDLEPWHQSVMYPTTGTGRTVVDFEDIERLDEGEFLNDNLVGYALRRIEEDMAPEHKSKVHFFNSYFFTSLTSKSGRKAFNYDAVKKWTKQKDLLNTPYIVVPINENLHWFVAIICNLPDLVRKPALLDDDAANIAETPAPSQRSSVQPSPIRDIDEIQDSQDSKKPDEQAMRQLSLDEAGEVKASGNEVYAFDDNGKLVDRVSETHCEGESTQEAGKQSGKNSKKRAAPSLRKYPTDKPTIITLDSFGVGHPGQVSTLKKYVEAEALDKRGMDAAAASIQGMTASGIPLQSNYCDCGLYLVGYVEEFAKDPEGFVNKVLNRELDQESHFASFDPSQKRAEIRDDLLRLHAEQDQARIALKKAKKEEKLLQNKVAATAVNAAQTPGTSVRPSPAPPASQVPAKQSAKAQLPIGGLSAASRMPSEEIGHLRHALSTQHESGTQHQSKPDPTLNST